MKTKLSILVFFGITILLFTSCDPGFSYTKKIVNSSNYDVLIIVADTNHKHAFNAYGFDSLKVVKHSESEIASDGGLGNTSPYEKCDYFNDSLIVKIIGFDTLHLTVDINDCSNWKYTQISEKSGGVGECKFVIDDWIIK